MKNDDIKYSDPQNLETMKFKIIDNCQAIARTLTQCNLTIESDK